MKKKFILLGASLACTLPLPSKAAMVITEWMYNGLGTGGLGEFIEFTNTGSTAIDLTGWSFDDDSAIPGVVDLSLFGLVQPGQSVILTERSVADFRSTWDLSDDIVIIGDLTTNLGRNDAIHLFDADNNIIDSLVYGDENFTGSIRTQGVSGVTDPSNYGANNVLGWYLSSTGDGLSWTSTAGEIGSPGIAVIPEPSSLALLSLGSLAWFRRRR